MFTSPSGILLVTTLFVTFLGTLVYARALHNHTGVPDLSTVLGNVNGEGTKDSDFMVWIF